MLSNSEESYISILLNLPDHKPTLSGVFINRSLLFNSGEESLWQFPVAEECTENYPTLRNEILTLKPVTFWNSIIHLGSVPPVQTLKSFNMDFTHRIIGFHMNFFHRSLFLISP